jgi:uncharacterized delta-60 repeat protein
MPVPENTTLPAKCLLVALFLLPLWGLTQSVIRVDPTFNSIGYHTLDLSPGNYQPQAGVTIKINPPDGRYLVRNQGNSFVAYVKYKQDGTLDLGFNGVGYAYQPELTGPNFYFDDQYRMICTKEQGTGVAFLRTLQNGQPDNTFGVNGTLTVPNSNGKTGGLFKLADGSYLSINMYDSDPGSPLRYGIRISKFKSDFTVNTSFGTNGTKEHDLDYLDLIISAVQLYSDGRILIGGTSRTATIPNGYDYNATFFRFLPDGSFDPAFGTNGISTLYFADGLEEGINDVLLAPNGQIYGFGFYGRFPSADRRGLMVRLKANGGIDSTFGIFGRRGSTATYELTRGTMQRDGKLVVAGWPGYTIERATADGFDDLQFGTNGAFLTPYTSTGGFPFAILLENDTTVVLAGNAFTDNQSNNVTVARYKINFQPYITGILSRYCSGATATGQIINMPRPGSDTSVSVLLDNVSVSVNAAGSFSFATGAAGQHTVDIRFTKGATIRRESIKYTVLTNTAPVITTQDAVLCTGSNLNIVADGAVYWSGPGITSSLTPGTTGAFKSAGLPTGTYKIVATRDNGPCGLRRDTITIQLIDLAPVITANGNVLSTAVIPGASYRWYRNNSLISGAVSNQYTATQSGSYQVQVSLPGGCLKLSPEYVYTIVITAIIDPVTGRPSYLYPNPAKKETFINGLDANKRYEYRLISREGRVIYNWAVLSAPYRINTAALAPGVYYLDVREKKKSGDAQVYTVTINP